MKMVIGGLLVALLLAAAAGTVGQAVPVTPGAEKKLAATRDACSEKDIFHYTQIVRQGELLIDRRDTQLLGRTRRFYLRLLPAVENAAFIWLVYAGDNLN